MRNVVDSLSQTRRGRACLLPGLRAIVAALTADGYQPKRAKRWHPATVARVLARQDQVAWADRGRYDASVPR
jgi:hypothetical protein